MRISIHGTQDGGKTFTKEILAGVKDPSSDNPSDNSIGGKSYAISFTKNRCVFTKYGIIRDVQGERRTGNIGFSVGISYEDKISGKHIKQVLDELEVFFYDKYIQNDNLDSFQENWSFVDDIKHRYQEFVNPIFDRNEIEIFSQGETDAAYIYYSSKEELQKYFDDPYIEEYKTYKRVFFVDEKYRGTKENPLNALRHDSSADLTSLKLLENLRYRIIIPIEKNDISAHITTSEGKEVSNKGKVHPNDKLHIIFKRDNYKYPPINKSINDLKTQQVDGFVVDEANRKLTITLPELIDLTPIKKGIGFRIENWKGNEIKNAEITIESKESTEIKSPGNNKVEFLGDELVVEWEVKLDGQKIKSFIPKNSNEHILITVSEQRAIEFKVKPSNFKLSVSPLNNNIKIERDRIIFINGAIEEEYTVTISTAGYKSKTLKHFIPNDIKDGIILESLEKKKQVTYYIDVNGGENKGGDHIEMFEDENINKDAIKRQIKAPKGMVVKDFEISNENHKRYDGKITVVYDKKPGVFRNKKILGVASAALILLILGFVLSDTFFGSPVKDEVVNTNLEYDNIVEFTNGIIIKLSEIDSNIVKVTREIESQDTSNINVPESKGFFSFFFRSDEEEQVITKKHDVPEWENLLMKLESLKLIRQAINDGEIDSLIVRSERFEYSKQQSDFKNAVLKIDTSYSKIISEAINKEKDNVSLMDLNQVVEFIENNISTENKSNEIPVTLEIPTQDKEITEKPKDIFTTEKVKEEVVAESISPKGTPEGEKNGKEAEFEEEFWKLVKEPNKTKSKYDDLIKRYSDISSNNEIKKFYNTYLSRTDEFKYFKDIPEMRQKKAKDLDGLRKLIEEQK